MKIKTLKRVVFNYEVQTFYDIDEDTYLLLISDFSIEWWEGEGSQHFKDMFPIFHSRR